MASEESPLLQESLLEHDKVYDRFTARQKRTIVFVVSWAALIPLFVSGSFVPSIPQVAREFDSTGSVVNLAVSLSLFSSSVSSLFWATYSGFYGRRPIYLASLPCLCIGSLGVASSHSVPSLMAWRVFQAFGTSSGISVGAGVIGDIYRIEERGAAIGKFFAASLLGAALAPLAGGLATHYASWRDMQYVLFVAGLMALVHVVVFLPETSHPGARGVDKLLDDDEVARPKWVWLNPFRCLALFRGPSILVVTLIATCGLLTDYVLLIPLSYTIGVRYHISNEALIGAFFMAAGVGNILGAPLAGRISDAVVVKWRKRRAGAWVPEDRLRATLLPGGTLVPLSVLFAGLTTQFVPGRLGIVLNLLCLFMNGLGVDLTLSPINTYLVDIMQSRSAEVIAAHKGVRHLIVAVATTGILPLINTIGVARTNAIAAVIAWVGCGLLWVTVTYGPRPLPLIGNIHQFPFEYHQKVFAEWGRTYGPVIYAKILHMDVVILNSVQAAEDLMEKRGTMYSDRPHFSLITDLIGWAPNMALMPYTHQWRRHRRWYQAAIGTQQSLSGYGLFQERESLKLLLNLFETPRSFIAHLKTFPGAIMEEITYGHPAGCDGFVTLADKAMNELVELGGLAATLIDFMPILQHLPAWAPGAGFKRRAIKTRVSMLDMMHTPYEAVKKEMLTGSAKPSFLRAVLEEHSQGRDPTPEEEAEMECASSLMYSAGSETSMTVLQTFMLAMVIYPQVFQKAQAEIDRVIGHARLPEFSDRASLPYLECVLKEVYRWNPVVPLGVPHRVVEDDEYNGLHIPKGSMVVSNIWGMTRDPEMYPDPERFWPERFEGMGETESMLKDPRRVVFGFGRRICPGRLLGDASIWLAVARMVATLDVRRARDADGTEITPLPAFTSGAASHVVDFVCDVRPRSQRAVALVEAMAATVA
ncbi:uncharacterized protein FIBRA_06716 [Fibroporia radiculosa]|uniref:Major facilitator superfamily (MFS) profile domain-containing protein n=1 Tax=Fibroporia radiculosa TaxID=599839 RepID=J4GTB8_9APHY|nr:uncharacterized protein FIBRA_06716 [Fibroporia radiculosa]CCM04535.1 predicted protein [Fibroporia radiculosa]